MTVKNWRASRTENIQYITPDGKKIELHDPPTRSVVSMTGWGHPSIEVGTSRGPYQDGDSINVMRLAPRRIDLVIRLIGYSRSDFWKNRQTLLEALRVNRSNMNLPQEGTLVWIRADGTKRAVACLLDSSMPLSPIAGSFSVQEAITFIAHNPYIFEPVDNEVTITGFHVTNPKSTTISYQGTAGSFPVIEITGPCDSITVKNTSTNKSIILEYAVSAGETVTIELTYDRKSIYNSSGDNLLGYLDISSSALFEFSIQPNPITTNGSNTLEFDLPGAAGDTEVKITYRNWYIGI